MTCKPRPRDKRNLTKIDTVQITYSNTLKTGKHRPSLRRSILTGTAVLLLPTGGSGERSTSCSRTDSPTPTCPRTASVAPYNSHSAPGSQSADRTRGHLRGALDGGLPGAQAQDPAADPAHPAAGAQQARRHPAPVAAVPGDHPAGAAAASAAPHGAPQPAAHRPRGRGLGVRRGRGARQEPGHGVEGRRHPRQAQARHLADAAGPRHAALAQAQPQPRGGGGGWPRGALRLGVCGEGAGRAGAGGRGGRGGRELEEAGGAGVAVGGRVFGLGLVLLLVLLLHLLRLLGRRAVAAGVGEEAPHAT